MIDFTGQVAVITGAGRGLGRLYAIELARRGASVVVNDIGGSMCGDGADPTVADDVVGEIRAAGGGAVSSHASVDTPEGGEIVATAIDAFGKVDAVVSNAGILTTGPFDELTRRGLAPHARRAPRRRVLLAQPAFRAMKAQGHGRFVFTAPRPASSATQLEAHYAAAKAGIFGLTNAVAIDGAAHGIRANMHPPVRLLADGLGAHRPPQGGEETRLPQRHRARAGRTHGGVPRQPRLRDHPPQLLGARRPLLTGVRRAHRRLGGRPGASPPPRTSPSTSRRSRPPRPSASPARSTTRSSRSPKGSASAPYAPRSTLWRNPLAISRPFVSLGASPTPR